MIKNLFHLPLLKLMVQRQQEDQPKQGFSDKIKDSEQMWHFGYCCDNNNGNNLNFFLCW